MFTNGYKKPTIYFSGSDTEAMSYAINEARAYGTQTITTRLPYLEEININDDNAIILEFDCSNIKEVVEKIKKQAHKRIEWNVPKDNYRNILAEGKSRYKEMIKGMARVRVKVRFRDTQNNLIWREVGNEIICDETRAKQIADSGYGEIIEEVIEPVEKAVKEVKKEKAVKEKATKKVEPEKKAVKRNAKK